MEWPPLGSRGAMLFSPVNSEKGSDLANGTPTWIIIEGSIVLCDVIE